MMSGLLARRLLQQYQITRDPVRKLLSVLQIFQHGPFLQSNAQSFTLLIHQKQYIHISCVHSRRRSDDPEEMNKAVKSKRVKVVTLRPNMTVTDLAHILNVPLDDVQTSLVVITEKEYEPDQEIQDVTVLKKVTEMFKQRYKITKVKKSSSKTVIPSEEIEENVKIEEIEDSKDKKKTEQRDIERQGPPDPTKLVNRPPVVTIMGHVDHGKTTLLDALRESRVVDQEFGGITQHIGAFNVKLPSGRSITFLDTPGHAAFSSMRARGASVTDIVVLVIAGEDGIMPQTVESIKHAQKSNVPLVVAINKIDKHGVNFQKTKNMLSAYGVEVEEHGGDVQVVPISALKRINLDKLEDAITTLAEVLELKGDPNGMVEGRIIETRTDTGRGKLATLLVQRGTLKKGDLLLAGTAWTRVRSMHDSNGQILKDASVSMPVEVGGWKDLPQVGEEVLQFKTEKRLKKALQYRLDQLTEQRDAENFEAIQEKRKEEREIYLLKRKEKVEIFRRAGFSVSKRISIGAAERKKGGDLLDRPEQETSDRPVFHIIIKGDVAGSVEAILNTLATFRSEVCDLDIMYSGVGDVSQHDVELAELFGGHIYAFNVGLDPNAVISDEVKIKMHNVIYHLFDDLSETIESGLPLVTKEEIIGEATILQEYVVKMKHKDENVTVCIAGCRCTSGNLDRKNKFRILRNKETIYEGHIASLKHHKAEVITINTEQECGICFSASQEVPFKPGDTVICYSTYKEKQTLDWEPGYLDDMAFHQKSKI